MEKTVNFNLTEYADCVPVPSAILGMRSVKQKTESENKGA